MKYTDLVVGQKYWCGWASRFAYFVKIQKQTWCVKTSYKAIFCDICDCFIECDIDNIKKWVITCEEFKYLKNSIAK